MALQRGGKDIKNRYIGLETLKIILDASNI